MSGIIPYMQSSGPNVVAGGAPEGSRQKHGCYPEDLLPIAGGNQICGVCLSYSNGSYERYVKMIATYHEIDLSGARQESEFLVAFGNLDTSTGEHAVMDQTEKLSRLNAAKKLFASMLGQK